jgi:uridine phosphorylase
MSAGDSYKTQKIAKHRVHIERLIAKVKTFQILSNTVTTVSILICTVYYMMIN